MRQLLILSSVIGPGLITANVDNDATGITGYSLAGAQYGYGLLWAVVLVTISLAVVQEIVARMGVVTGKGLADLIREHFVELVLGLITAFAVVTINVLFAFSQWDDKVGEMQQENEKQKLDGMAPRPMREL